MERLVAGHVAANWPAGHEELSGVETTVTNSTRTVARRRSATPGSWASLTTSEMVKAWRVGDVLPRSWTRERVRQMMVR